MEESSQKVKREIEYPEVCRLWAPGTKLPKDLDRAQTLYCARIGLAHYNKEQGTNYKLLEPIASARLLGEDLLHFHCHFLAAKPKTSLVEEYFYSELFFVDFFYHNREHVEVCTSCLIPRHLAKTDYFRFKCKFCLPDLAHPWPWGIPQLFTRCKACKREFAERTRSARQCR